MLNPMLSPMLNAGQPPGGTPVGRRDERETLARALDQAAAGEGQLVILEGEAGIGKTFLLGEALAHAQLRGFCCCAAAAEELERHRPFGAIAEALGVGRRGRRARAPLCDAPSGVEAAGLEQANGQAGVPQTEDSLLAALRQARAEQATAARRADLAAMMAGETPVPASTMLPGAPEAEFRIVDAIIDLVEHLCDAGPLVVAIEDLQWADASSLLAINRLAREIPGLPVLAVATMRPLPRGAELQALVDGLIARGANRIALQPLPAGAIAQLAEGHLGARPGPGLLAQLSRAGGNPFFATELLACLQREGSITVAGGIAEVAGSKAEVAGSKAEVAVGKAKVAGSKAKVAGAGRGDEPIRPTINATAEATTLHATILARLSYLSEDTIETLQVAAILGPSFAVADLAAIVGRPMPDLLAELRSAVLGGLLQGDSRLLTFRHALIQETLYREMPHAVRVALHLTAATSLLENGLSAEEVAEHVVRGALPGDLETIEWLTAIARQAGTRSPAIAAELLQRALELTPEGHASRDATLSERAAHLLSIGRLAEAEAICVQTLARAHDPAVEGRLRLCLVQAYVGQGRVAESLLEIDDAVASPALSERERGRLWAWSSTCRVILWDLDAAIAHADLALELCNSIGDDLGTTVALAGRAAVHNLQGHFHEALALGTEALLAARQSRSPEARRLQLTLMHALMLIDLDRLDEAQRALRRGRSARERRGARWNLPSYHFVSALGRFQSGEWDEAIAQFDSACDFAEEVVVYQGQLAAHGMRSMIALHRGDLDCAEREILTAEDEAAPMGPQWRSDWMLWARALLAEAQGQPDAALRTLAKAWDLCAGAGVMAEFPIIGPDLVRLAIGGGEPLLAEEVTTALEALARTAGVASVSGAAFRCRGILAGDPELLVSAVNAYRAGPRRRELALACEDAATALGRARRLAEARPLAEEALEVYRSLDARRDSSRAQARFRQSGLRSGSRGERARPKSGWASLTVAEMSVAGQVAAGLSNPEIARRLFVSRRTVQSHVSHALEKLGLCSRVELAVEVARQEESDWQTGLFTQG